MHLQQFYASHNQMYEQTVSKSSVSFDTKTNIKCTNKHNIKRAKIDITPIQQCPICQHYKTKKQYTSHITISQKYYYAALK